MVQRLIQDTLLLEPDKSFILSYHFIGYVGDENSGKITKAIEIGAEEEVIIFFLEARQMEGSEHIMIQYLLHHRAFHRVKYVKSLRDSTAFVAEYCAWPSLSEYVRCKGPVSEDGIYKIFIQLLDAIAYLHTHGIACNGIEPDNILVSDKLEIKINSLRKSKFYDFNGEQANEKDDICAIGKVVVFLLSGGIDEMKWNEEIFSDSAVSCASDERLRESLKYIFQHKKSLELLSLYNINNIEGIHFKRTEPQVFVLDLLVIEVLSIFGIDRVAVAENANIRSRKEHFMYSLCRRRIGEELRLIIPRGKLGSNRDKSICAVYNARERQKELLDLKYKLYLNTVEAYGSWFRQMFCRSEGVCKISVSMLTPLHRSLRFAVRNGCNFHDLGKNSIRVMAKNVELEMSVTCSKNKLFRMDRRRGDVIVFQQISGTKQDFVHLTISILEGIAVKSMLG